MESINRHCLSKCFLRIWRLSSCLCSPFPFWSPPE